MEEDIVDRLNNESKETDVRCRLMCYEAAKEIVQLRKELSRKHCPCEFGDPCSSHCSCGNPNMSGGCYRCCSYGNEEQQKFAAKCIIERENKVKEAYNILKGSL